jgi:hypothetical protein
LLFINISRIIFGINWVEYILHSFIFKALHF